jgi:mono/diheme cytochrome c family protein
MHFLATGLYVVAVFAVTAVFWWRSANVGPVQRGADLAVAQGCLGCDGGLGVSPLLPRPFGDLDDIDPATPREWILDGMPRRVRQDPERREALKATAIRMPAWRGRLSHAEVDDVVAYLRALAAADVPEEPLRLARTAAPQPALLRAVGTTRGIRASSSQWPAGTGRGASSDARLRQQIHASSGDGRRGSPEPNLHRAGFSQADRSDGSAECETMNDGRDAFAVDGLGTVFGDSRGRAIVSARKKGWTHWSNTSDRRLIVPNAPVQLRIGAGARRLPLRSKTIKRRYQFS